MIPVWEVGRLERLKDLLRQAVNWDSNTGQGVGFNAVRPFPVIDLTVYWGGSNIPK